MTISEAFTFYISRELVMKGRAKRTIENYLNTKTLLVRFLGNIDITEISFDDLLSFRQHLDSYQSIDTVSNNIIRIRCLLRFLNKAGLSVIDYSEIPVPSKQKKIASYISHDEFEQILSLVSQRHRGYSELNRLRNIAVCNLLFYSGIRISELCSLNRDSIKNCSFVVIGKSKYPRICFLNKTTEKAIDDYLNARSDQNQALFINSYGNRLRPDSFRKSLHFLSKRFNMGRIHPHMFRHVFASYLLENNVDLIYISDLLGHQSLDTTKKYTHYKNTKLQQLYDKVVI